MARIVKRVSRGTRLNQVYLQKNEGAGFEPGASVVICPLDDMIAEPALFEHNVKLEPVKRDIARKVFGIVRRFGTCDNILITGSFLDKGFGFEDIDIVVVNPVGVGKDELRAALEQAGLCPHLILIDAGRLTKGIRQDPLFRLMADRYVSAKRALFRKDRETDYRLLDTYLMRTKSLVEGFDLLSVRERGKLLRDVIGIKLFAEGREVTHTGIWREAARLFGRETERFLCGASGHRRRFLAKMREELNKLERLLLRHAEQTRPHKTVRRGGKQHPHAQVAREDAD